MEIGLLEVDLCAGRQFPDVIHSQSSTLLSRLSFSGNGCVGTGGGNESLLF